MTRTLDTTSLFLMAGKLSILLPYIELPVKATRKIAPVSSASNSDEAARSSSDKMLVSIVKNAGLCSRNSLRADESLDSIVSTPVRTSPLSPSAAVIAVFCASRPTPYDILYGRDRMFGVQSVA